MKTLFYTCIYSNLWGTELGGRPSRNHHYKFSLLNLLNLNADKFICFTSSEELEELKRFFYTDNNISENKLEFKVFNLKDTNYFSKIQKIKKIDEVKKSDRCYEIQYNKFFWLDSIENLKDYDRVFWIDAGLSHGGIIDSKYSHGNGLERNYNFSIFNSNLLHRLCGICKDRVLLLSKNNDGVFYWSSSIPSKYYKSYNRSEHIIGGLFGSTPQKMIEYKEMFEKLLIQLLECEDELYYEELIMTCIYFNESESFCALKFDDWYDRKDEKKYGKYVRYFYNMLEVPNVCVASLCFELSENSKRYVESSKKLISTKLKYTNFDILILTNKREEFQSINDARVRVIYYNAFFNENVTSNNRFNMHLKRYPLKLAQEHGYAIIYYNDCDCFIDGWDESSFNNKIEEDFDVYYVSHANPQLGALRKEFKHFQEKIDTEFCGIYDDKMDLAPNPAETRVIFKNNEKLSSFLSFWDKISNNNKNFFTYYDGVYFGTSSIYADMKMGCVTRNDAFAKFCYINHGNDILDYFGVKTNINKDENVINISTHNMKHVKGQFEYKGLYALQNSNVFTVFEKLFLNKKPKRILEIGTEYGGLTLIMKDILLKLNIDNFLIRTYDIKSPTFLLNHNDLDDHIEVLVDNIFQNNPFAIKTDKLNDIKSFLSSECVNIVLCDGGDKKNEFNVLSDFLKSGDIIMAHDYAKDLYTFENKIKNKVWNWFEIQESDIEDCTKRNNLKFYMQDEFEKIAWVCKIKE